MSSTNFMDAARKRGSAALAHVGVALQKIYPHSRVTHSDGQSLNYPNSSQLVLHQNEEDRFFQATTGTADALKQASFVDVRLPAGSLQLVKGMTLELKILNNTGASISPAYYSATNEVAGALPGVGIAAARYCQPAQALIERVELLAESGSTLISRTESSQMLNDFRYMDISQAALLRQASDLGPEGGVDVTLLSTPPAWVDGESRTAYVPLFNALTQNNVFCGGLSADLYVRVWFRGAAAWQTAPNGPPTLQSMSLIVRQDNLARPEHSQLLQRYRSETLDFRFMRPSFQSITENLSPNQRYQFQLTAVHGLISDMAISVRGTSGTGTFLIGGHRNLTSVELLDSSGSNIIGGSALPAEYVRKIKGAFQTGNPDQELLPPRVYFFDFGSTRANREHSTLTGYIVGDGALQLAFTTGASVTTGSFEIRIEYNAAARMRVAGGSITVYPS
jgi:hypothetical protein